MTALARERKTVQYGNSPKPLLIPLPVKANTKIYDGSIVVIDAGYAAPARTATGLLAAGVARLTVDNTGGAAGALWLDVEPGTFKFANSASGDLIAQADVGKLCYLVDDQTVAKTDGTGTRSIAGRIIKVDTDGVFVNFDLANN